MIRHAVVVAALVGCSMTASAQNPSPSPRPESSAVTGPDRLPAIPAAQLTDEQKKAIAEFEAARKTGISGPFVPMLRSPEVMNRARAMGDYLRYNSSLPPRLSEFAILITARRWSQNYEWDAHNRLALQGGLSPEIVKALIADRRPDKMAADEEALYNLCDELHRTQHVSDATYARAVAIFGEKGVIDILGIQGYYTLLAMVLNTARTPVPPGSTPALTTIPR
jgi:4-carboxymuconolactone decarboxylase